MLRDAALLQLDLTLAALDEGLTLKDATPFNVQWIGAQPTLIDVGSFTAYEPGAPWAGYRQFCEMFLYPLFLQAYRNIPFHPWLRGRLDGITAAECRSLLSARDCLRAGVLTHVHLQAAAQARCEAAADDVGADLRSAGFHAALIRNNVARLRRTVERLRWTPSRSTWSDYQRIISASVVRDADLDVRNNYEADFRAPEIYGPVDVHAVQTPEAWWPLLTPGLGVLLAAPWALGGVLGARLAMYLIVLPLLALGAWCWLREGVSPAATGLAVTGMVGSVPVIFGGSQMYPDMPCGVIVLSLLAWTCRPGAPTG